MLYEESGKGGVRLRPIFDYRLANFFFLLAVVPKFCALLKNGVAICIACSHPHLPACRHEIVVGDAYPVFNCLFNVGRVRFIKYKGYTEIKLARMVSAQRWNLDAISQLDFCVVKNLKIFRLFSQVSS